uniref:NADH dehydrogenase subunit 6 n=1 Tax=Flustra foliacea TaxID=478208 RepID=H2ESU6_9BILA|nr:NADH dehydrogenase subunit 6 [Flustra foliacea]AEX16064.1 NADH dehydrogenase subunit 6 [Flustra foliacea]
MLITTFMIPFFDTLVSMGAAILLMALFSTLVIAGFLNSWFSFVLFLVYVSGLLVLFSYMLAMSPNSQGVVGYKFSYFIYGFVVLLVSIFCFSLLGFPDFVLSFEWEVISLFSLWNMGIYWLMMVVLLLALIMVVSLCFKSPSPLRPFMSLFG